MDDANAPDAAPRSALTAGVDLAAEPRKTALAIVEWSAGGARLVSLAVGVLALLPTLLALLFGALAG